MKEYIDIHTYSLRIYIYIYICIYIYIIYIIYDIYIYIYIYDSQIVQHNPCFNSFILLHIPFDNRGSEIHKNDIFLRFFILSITKTFFLLHIQ